LILAYEAGEGTLDEVADTFGVSRRTVARMMRLWRLGQSLEPLPHGGGYPATLNERLLVRLREQVTARPDATLSELASFLKRKARARVHPSNICRALQELGLPRKKVMWLPAYSPDFSPIENCWSKVKTLVRGRQPRTP
jgi:transposase